jgi:hypothetical protein
MPIKQGSHAGRGELTAKNYNTCLHTEAAWTVRFSIDKWLAELRVLPNSVSETARQVTTNTQPSSPPTTRRRSRSNPPTTSTPLLAYGLEHDILPSLVFDFAPYGNMQGLMEQCVETLGAQTVIDLDAQTKEGSEGQFWFGGPHSTGFANHQPLDTPGGKLDFWLSDLVFSQSVTLPGEFVRPKTGSVLFHSTLFFSLLVR